MTTLMEFSMFPLDKGSSLSSYVAKVLDVVDSSSFTYRLTPMGTIVEGEFDALLALLSSCFKILEPASERISLSVKFDHRRGENPRLDQKIESVETKLGRKLRTT